MALDEETLQFREQLYTEWTKDEAARNLERVAELLSMLKRKLINLVFLPELGHQPSKQELVLARYVLEVGAQYGVVREDLAMFERYLAQLRCYYFDYQDVLEESPYMNELLGLNLLSLLAQGRLAEFHTELELLPAEQLTSCVYYRFPVQLEQYLMEGCYNKVFALRAMSPAKSYMFLLDMMTGTMRQEIATCIEKAYTVISPAEAQRMLFFSTGEEFMQYLTSRNWQRNDKGEFAFSQPEPEGRLVSSEGLIGNALTYAKELERIV